MSPSYWIPTHSLFCLGQAPVLSAPSPSVTPTSSSAFAVPSHVPCDFPDSQAPTQWQHQCLLLHPHTPSSLGPINSTRLLRNHPWLPSAHTPLSPPPSSNKVICFSSLGSDQSLNMRYSLSFSKINLLVCLSRSHLLMLF